MQQIVVCRVPSEQAEEEEILAALELWWDNTIYYASPMRFNVMAHLQNWQNIDVTNQNRVSPGHVNVAAYCMYEYCSFIGWGSLEKQQ